MRTKDAKPLLIGIIALALGARLAVALLTTSWVFPSDDHFWTFGYEMGQIAASLAMGNGFTWPDWSLYPKGPTSWMAPVYPFIMAGAFKLFGVYTQQAAIALEIFLTVISALTCLLVYSLGKRLYNVQVGLLAAFFLAIYPPSIHYAIRSLWDTSLFTFCLLLVILMFLRLADHPHTKGGIYLGMTSGFAALVNPIVVSAFPFACAWLYVRANSSRNTVLKTLTLMLTSFCIVISPWLIRNYLVFGQFVFIKSNFGHELYLGTRGASADLETRMKEFTEPERQFLAQSNEATRNKFYLEKAIAFITEHPLHFIQKTAIRFITFWTYMRPRGGLLERLTLACYFLVLLLAVAGLFFDKVKRRDVQLVLLFLLSLPIPYYLTVAHLFRYRFPVEPLLLIFAGHMIYTSIMFFSSKEAEHPSTRPVASTP